MTLVIKLSTTGKLSIDTVLLVDLLELQSVLSVEASKIPQPNLRLEVENSEDFERISKIIYLVHRLGFEDGKLIVD